MKINTHRIFDPLYGVMQISGEEFSIIKSPEIQRLRYVRMCNINSMLVTGASEISRFEHVLGVLRLSKEWSEYRGKQYRTEVKREIFAAALLHDFQTGPFGHSMQYIFEDNESSESFIHDDLEYGIGRKFHQIADASAAFSGRPFCAETILGNKWKTVASLIRGEGKLGPLISGSIDLDNIDNVFRLGYHVGVANQKDAEIAIALARDLESKDGVLLISEESIAYIERWQAVRRKLYELLLLDWAEFSAKAMLTRAMELAIDYELLGTDSWLKTDLELFNYLEMKSLGDSQEVKVLINKIRCGELYEPIYLGTTDNVSIYEKFSSVLSKRKLEENVESLLKDKFSERVDVLIHPILDNKKTDRSVSTIIRETEENLTIGEDSKQLLIGVFVSRVKSHGGKFMAISALIQDFLVAEGATNILPLKDPMGEMKAAQMELL